MATTVSYNQIAGETDLDVKSVFNELMQASTERGSMYLRAKETIVDYVEKGQLDEREKASLVAKHITDLAQNMTAQTLQAAVQIAKENRDAKYTLTKTREDTKLTTAQTQKILADVDKTDIDTKLGIMAIKKAQSELYADYGVNAIMLTTDVENLTSAANFDARGSKYEAIKMAQANVYNGYATSFRQNGFVNIVVDDKGYVTAGTTGDATGLSYWQAKVAERNEEGFDDNMRQHVANSSATLVSMLLSSEDATLSAQAQVVLDKWSTAVNYLNEV